MRIEVSFIALVCPRYTEEEKIFKFDSGRKILKVVRVIITVV